MSASFEESIRQPSSAKIEVRAAQSAIRVRDWSLCGAPTYHSLLDKGKIVDTLPRRTVLAMKVTLFIAMPARFCAICSPP
jgi:hypothetical protein